MAAAKVYRVAAAFFHDHQSRDLFVGRVVRTMARTIDVELDAEGYEALRADAVYYAEEMMNEDNVTADTVTVARSAERVVKALDKAGPPAPLSSAEAERRAQERAARDAADRERHAAFLRGIDRERADRERADAERRAREDLLDSRLLVRIENTQRAMEGIEPAEATRILRERAKAQA